MKDSVSFVYDGSFNKFPEPTFPNASTGRREASESGETDDITETTLKGSGTVFAKIDSIIPG